MSTSPDLTRALALVNAEIEERLAAQDLGAAALLVRAGRRIAGHDHALVLLGFLPWHRELLRLRRLAGRAGAHIPIEDLDLVDRLAALALQGRRPDSVEAVSVTQEEWARRERRRLEGVQP